MERGATYVRVTGGHGGLPPLKLPVFDLTNIHYIALLHIHRLEQVKKIRYLNRRRLLYEKDFLEKVPVADCGPLLLDNPVVRKLHRSGCNVREKEHPTQCAQCVFVCGSHIRLDTVRLLCAVRSSAHSSHFSNVEGLLPASLRSRPLSVP